MYRRIVFSIFISLFVFLFSPINTSAQETLYFCSGRTTNPPPATGGNSGNCVPCGPSTGTVCVGTTYTSDLDCTRSCSYYSLNFSNLSNVFCQEATPGCAGEPPFCLTNFQACESYRISDNGNVCNTITGNCSPCNMGTDAGCAFWGSNACENSCVITPDNVPPGTPPTGGRATIPTTTDCNGTNGIQTAIGCVPLLANNSLTGFVGFFLRWGGGIVGGIGIIMIIYSGFMIMTSSGDPKKVQAGKELLGASIAGIVMLIFAGFILRIIGSDILRIF